MQSNGGSQPAAREGEANAAAPAGDAAPAVPAPAPAAIAGGTQAAQGASTTTADAQQAPANADQAQPTVQAPPSGAVAAPTPAAPAPAPAPPSGGAVKDKEEPPTNTATPAAATTAAPAGPAKGKLDSAALTASLNKLPSAKPREREPLNGERASFLARAPRRNVTADGRGRRRPMKRTVKDALSYLDQVKSKFANQADVYNDFLDMCVQSRAVSSCRDS